MERPKAFLSYTKMSTKTKAFLQFSDVAWVPTLLGIFLLSGTLVPYIIVLLRGTLNPLLPFISQAGGSPPQSGILSICMALSAVVGFIGLHMLHLGICVYQERVPEEKKRLLKFLNSVSLIPGHLSLLGMIIAGAYPLDFHRHNDDWFLVTVGPHITGALFLFGGGVSYTLLLTIIMAITFPQKKTLISLRVFLLIVTIVSSLIHAFTVRQAFKSEYYDEDRLKLCFMKPIQYDGNYLICAACEWVMAAAFISFYFTVRSEGKLMSLTLAVDLLDNPSDNQDSTCCIKTKRSPSNASSTSTEKLLDDCKSEIK